MPLPAGSRLDRFLRLFADVRPGEGPTALLLGLNVFLILMAYYVLKPVREALVLGEGTAAGKTYLSVVEVFLLAGAVPLYGWLVRRMDRRRLINSVTGFFVACLLAFFALGHVGFGASLGAVVGAGLAGGFIKKIGVLELMLVGAGLLVVEVLVTNYVDSRERARGRQVAAPPADPALPAPKGGAFGLVFKTRYLLLIALVMMLHNTVKKTGEYILGHTVRQDAAIDSFFVRLGDVGAAGLVFVGTTWLNLEPRVSLC